MWLLNKTTLELEYFISDAPPYLILSHRWSGQETTLQNFSSEKRLPAEQWSPGTHKVMQFCHFAASYSVNYLWIDTICIDKTSSAELQEAINSMYTWYAKASSCIVHLNDVDRDVSDNQKPQESVKLKEQFAASEWFTRGWTLQELLAPSKLRFVDSQWKDIGTRNEWKEALLAITGIDHACYGKQAVILCTPVAKRMSWLSGRSTSRPEDLAYCMIGVFGVSMTMLYGEGMRAFVRLQDEIINEVNDDSIFIWKGPKDQQGAPPRGVLAVHPDEFGACRDYDIELDSGYGREPYRMTTRGLEIEHYDRRKTQFNYNLAIALNCKVDGKRACIPIVKDREKNTWHRARRDELVSYSDSDLLLPPTAEEAYHMESVALQMGRTSAHPDLQRRILGSRGSPASPGSQQLPGRSALDFSLECIKYKVFIE